MGKLPGTLDPGCELTLLDGEYVELASWVGCAARTVGPNEGPDNPLGDGGHRLHEWFLNGADSDHKGVPGRPPGVNGQVVDELLATGAVVCGRGTIEPAGFWGGDHHNGVPIFVLPAMRPTVRGASGRWSPM